ncbi:MAG: hypothetical protein IJU93_01760 [Lachnospiraceae bacterium]|nr:hypothetical protein [Lachnospiraceae bacterium]
MNINKLTLIITLFLSFSLFACSSQTNNGSSTPSGVTSDARESSVSAASTVSKDEVPDKLLNHLKLSIPDSGYEIYSPNTVLGLDYRYGPSILLNDDGSLDAWFSSPSFNPSEFDWITHRHSNDNGKTWSNEAIVLCPTPNSLDALSACDPDVFFHDGYYYIGYTSTIDETFNGLCNSVFLARSQNPRGPYEKWNGSGWGGNPSPIIYYDGVSIGWGIGEPSFVIVDDTLYVYTTKDSYSDDYIRTKSTEVYTADIRNENWPGRLSYAGCATVRSDTTGDAEYIYSDCDSWDVAYIEENNMFLALCTNRRFTDDSCLLYYESRDGINYDRVAELNTNVVCGCHNAGLMSDKNGHIKKEDNIVIGYAYSGSESDEWGIWSTRIAPLTIEAVEEVPKGEEGLENLKLPITRPEAVAALWTTGVNTDRTIYQQTADGGVFYITYYRLNNNYTKSVVNSSEITFSDYDPEIISVSRNMIRAKAPGTTPVTISYHGFSRPISLCVLPEKLSDKPEITELFSPKTEYNISMTRPYAVAIRPDAIVSGSTLIEMNSETMVNYGIKIEVEDEEICTVREDAVITPVSPGDTVIKVSAPSGASYEIKVHVTK